MTYIGLEFELLANFGSRYNRLVILRRCFYFCFATYFKMNLDSLLLENNGLKRTVAILIVVNPQLNIWPTANCPHLSSSPHLAH